MLTRALVIWFGILILAGMNGALRDAWLIPSLGERGGYAVSTLLLSAIVLLVTWLSIDWIEPASTRDTVEIGALWVSMTLAFEFLAGHYLFGQSWERLLEDYNVRAGRIWVLALIVTACAPFVTAAGRGLLRVRG